jgi:glucose/arabinose dehydrogenase
VLLASAAGPAAAVQPVAGRTTGVESQGQPGVTSLVSNLSEPLYVTHAGDARLFVVEKPGRIRIVKFRDGAWRIIGTFLDIRSRVGDEGSEQGLLGLAFHPDYESNGRFYVNYTNDSGDTVVAEYRRSSKNQASVSSQRVLMTIKQPFTNHNGGWLAFKGDNLYIATGDGGSGGDPGDRAQDLTSRLGKILRIKPIDPDGSGPRRFSIPKSNPFVGRAGNDAIWAYGLRNPWRNSFDRLTGDLWIADVGQNMYEEVNRNGSAKGLNFGWNHLEGRHLYPSGAVCTSNCRTLPIVEYDQGDGRCSVTGGYVSRRPGAALEGRYIYGDFCSGDIWNISAGHSWGDPVPAPFASGRLISSFGEGADGRIYLTDLTGSLWRVDGT